MSIIFTENFEGVGYQDANWTESVGGSNSLDSDALTSEVGSPFKWADQCLTVDNVTIASNVAAENSSMGSLPIAYSRFEFAVISHSLTTGQLSKMAEMEDGSGNDTIGILLFYTNNILVVLVAAVHGAGSAILLTHEIQLNTKYRVETKWDATNDLWEVRFNGLVLGRGDLTGAHAVTTGKIIMGSAAGTSTGIAKVAYDNIAIDDTDWIGSAGLSEAPSVRSDIVAAIVAQLKTITTVNGYNTELASNVINWQLSNVSLDSLPGVEVKDVSEESEKKGTLNYRTLEIEIIGRIASSDIDTARNFITDITTAMDAGPAYPSNVYLSTLIDSPDFSPEEKDKTAIKVTLAYEVKYRE